MEPKLLIFAPEMNETTGLFENLLLSIPRRLTARIVGVATNERGHHFQSVTRKSIKEYSQKSGHSVPVSLLNARNSTLRSCFELVDSTEATHAAFIGWNVPARGMNPCTTFNLYVPPQVSIPSFFGTDPYQVAALPYNERKGAKLHIEMLFVTEREDEEILGKGPAFFSIDPGVMEQETPEILRLKVFQTLLNWQPIMTNHIINGDIGWDGKDPTTLFGPVRFQ